MKNLKEFLNSLIRKIKSLTKRVEWKRIDPNKIRTIKDVRDLYSIVYGDIYVHPDHEYKIKHLIEDK